MISGGRWIECGGGMMEPADVGRARVQETSVSTKGIRIDVNYDGKEDRFEIITEKRMGGCVKKRYNLELGIFKNFRRTLVAETSCIGELPVFRTRDPQISVAVDKDTQAFHVGDFVMTSSGDTGHVKEIIFKLVKPDEPNPLFYSALLFDNGVRTWQLAPAQASLLIAADQFRGDLEVAFQEAADRYVRFLPYSSQERLERFHSIKQQTVTVFLPADTEEMRSLESRLAASVVYAAQTFSPPKAALAGRLMLADEIGKKLGLSAEAIALAWEP